MFLHIGGDVVLPKKDVVAILNVRASQAPITREFIEIATDEGFIKKLHHKNKIKSYIITEKEIFQSSISCMTLKKRGESKI